MGGINYYKPGDWSIICDSCGKKMKASHTKHRWDGFIVCDSCWEPRHSHDFIKVKYDKQEVPFSRRPQETFIDVPYVVPLSCTPLSRLPQADFGTADCAIVNTPNSTGGSGGGGGAVCDLNFGSTDAFPSFWSASESSTMLNTFDNPRPFTTAGSITLTSTFSVPTFSVTDGIVQVEISNFAAGAGPYRDMVLSVLDGDDNLLYEVLEPITSDGVFGAIIPLEIPEYSGIIKMRITMMPSITIPLPEFMFIDVINFPQCGGGGRGP